MHIGAHVPNSNNFNGVNFNISTMYTLRTWLKNWQTLEREKSENKILIIDVHSPLENFQGTTSRLDPLGKVSTAVCSTHIPVHIHANALVTFSMFLTFLVLPTNGRPLDVRQFRAHIERSNLQLIGHR